MKFDMNNVETERKKTLKYAEENDIDMDKINSIYDEIYEKLPDDLSDKAKELRALRKTRGSLRRIVRNADNYRDAFVFMRFDNKNFNKRAWDKVDAYVKKNGKEEAIENGMMNEEGEYLHTSYTTQFADQMGKVIDKDNIRGSALGLLKDEDGIDARFLSIGKFSVKESIPLCREISINVKESTSNGQVFTDKTQYFLNGAMTTSASHYYTSEDFQAYANMIEENCGDIYFDNKAEIDEYAQDHTGAYDFIGIMCTVNRLGDITENESIPIELELEDEVITVWARDYIFKDLTIEEDIAGIAFVHTYIKKDNTVGYNIGGFLPLADDDEE